MNIRNHSIEIQCSLREVNEVVKILTHSIIFFRTHGKFNYKEEKNYSIGSLGYERVDCSYLQFSYVRCSSPTLNARIETKIQEFVDKLSEYNHSGNLVLEFHTKHPNRWPFNDSKIVWESWTMKFILTTSVQQLETILSQKLIDVVEMINDDRIPLPQMPTQPNLDNVFDTSFYELQPYLYSLSYKVNENAPGDHSANVLTNASTQSFKKFLLGTLEL